MGPRDMKHQADPSAQWGGSGGGGGAYLTKLAEAGVLGVGDGVADRGEVDVGVVPHLPVLVLQPLVPRQLLRLLEELLVLGRHGRPLRPPPPPLDETLQPRMQPPSPDRCGGLGFQIVGGGVRGGSLDPKGGEREGGRGNKKVKSIFSKVKNVK